MPFILGANETKVTGYNVDNSVRFDGSSSYMSFAPASHMNMDRWTWSCWVKRSKLGAVQTLFNCDNAASDLTELQFLATDQLHFENLVSNSIKGKRVTTRVFRDVSSWMHIMVVWDSGNATAGDRIKIYINGVQETSFDTSDDPDQNTDSSFGENNQPIRIGVLDESNDYFGGYMCEVVVLDGTAAAVTDFGEFNEDSPRIWQPIDVSGLTFGTNGFYLDFEASDNLGNDANGGTDLTEVNLAAEDQASDSPTNNFCTLDPNASSPTITFSQGNCRHQNNSGNDQGSVGTFAVSTGKWYWEVKCVDRPEVGILTDTDRNVLPDNTVSPNAMLEVAGIVNSFGNGNDMRFNGATIDTNLTTSLADNDILSVAVDVDNEKIWFGKNGTWMNSGDPAAGSNEIKDFSDADTRFVTPFHNITTGNTDILEYNFGGCSAFTVSSANNDGDGYGNFEYSVPSGFYSLCTKNLAEYG